jgi:hypothetical protein
MCVSALVPRLRPVVASTIGAFRIPVVLCGQFGSERRSIPRFQPCLGQRRGFALLPVLLVVLAKCLLNWPTTAGPIVIDSDDPKVYTGGSYTF